MTQKRPRSIDVEGRTIKVAILKGLTLLGAARSQVTVRILAEETQGLFGMRGVKPAKVRITLKTERDSKK